jgi:hypothetical protein
MRIESHGVFDKSFADVYAYSYPRSFDTGEKLSSSPQAVKSNVPRVRPARQGMALNVEWIIRSP